MKRRNSWNVTGTYSGNEIIATFSGVQARDWIGDSSVPNGTQEVPSNITDIALISLEIFGNNIAVTSEKSWPADLASAIYELADEIEWSVDE